MSKSILLVDDQPAITVALMIRLQASGYEVNHAINGLAGVEAAALHGPDLIVLDIAMPDIDGYDAFVRIKRMKALAHVPIIFLSGSTDNATRDRALAMGAVAFVTKPYEIGQVIDLVEGVLGSGLRSAGPGVERTASHG